MVLTKPTRRGTKFQTQTGLMVALRENSGESDDPGKMRWSASCFHRGCKPRGDLRLQISSHWAISVAHYLLLLHSFKHRVPGRDGDGNFSLRTYEFHLGLQWTDQSPDGIFGSHRGRGKVDTSSSCVLGQAPLNHSTGRPKFVMIGRTRGWSRRFRKYNLCTSNGR